MPQEETATGAEWDVIIVGAGNAGMCAAIEIDRAGSTCLLLEADAKLGGASALTTGIYYAADTPEQRAAGIKDTPDDMFKYIMTLTQGTVRPDLLRVTCDHAAEGLKFLQDLGLDLHPEPIVSGGDKLSVPRGHSTNGKAGGVAALLMKIVRERNIGFRLNSRVTDLLVDGDRVAGVRAGDEEYRARAVIIASGGFANNWSLIERFWPNVAQHGKDRVWSVNAEAACLQGDGLLLAEKAGARIVGHDKGADGGVAVPTTGFRRKLEGQSAVAPWTILINLEGRRFMSETAPYSISGYLLNNQPEARCYAIFDHRLLEGADRHLGFVDPNRQGGGVGTSWTGEILRAKLADGAVISGKTLAELAAKTGIPRGPLEATVARYNADVTSGVDAAFFKTTGLEAIRQPPFYAVELRTAAVGLTCTGPEIDTSSRVLDTDGNPIPGLYAAGEVVGGSFGTRYPSGGISITNCIVFGRIAARTALAEAREAAG